MRNTILAAAAVLALATPAFAQNNVAHPPSDPTIQPAGGHEDPAMSAQIGQIQGSATGEGNMNGPNQSGQPGSHAVTAVFPRDALQRNPLRGG